MDISRWHTTKYATILPVGCPSSGLAFYQPIVAYTLPQKKRKKSGNLSCVSFGKECICHRDMSV